MTRARHRRARAGGGIPPARLPGWSEREASVNERQWREASHLRLRTLVASFVLIAGAGLILGAWQSGLLNPRSSPYQPRTTTAAVRATQKGQAAPDLEALLPNKINGVELRKGSTIGAVVFGSDAFSRNMTAFLASVGKAPTDLRFANAHDPSGKLDLETGVFQVRGVDALTLRQAIASSSRPDAPGLTISTATLSGKRVTMLVYPGGSILYLYAHHGLVFYVGTQNQALAAHVLAMYP